MGWKYSLGVMPYSFLKARLDRCCTLIEQGLPITVVYKTSGFGGYNHFFRAFKKAVSYTHLTLPTTPYV